MELSLLVLQESPKIIFTAHGWEFNSSERSFLSKLFFKFLSWITILLSHKTIAVSEAMTRLLRGWPFVYRKFEVIWNGVKPIGFLEKEESRNLLTNLDPRLRGDDGVRWVGTLAELHPIKGLDILIDAAKIVLDPHLRGDDDIQFIVMGTGELKEKLQKQIDKNNLTENFILLGYVEEAAKYLKAFDLFVLPSRSEALGLVILEAGLASLPVVATEVGGIPEIITDKENGLLVKKENKEELARAINEMLSDEKPFDEARGKAQKMAVVLNKKVSAKFSYKNMLEKTVDLYSN